ncbi:uncharacterized protein LOC143891036 [Tasmannia lanceolata]|uniref:uncharacterized protein LOC143891036 n=1 Tax=Tasmannia lanceolata TaxID=3420 RepID=UPI0040641622
MSIAHSTWPVVLIPYNLPPWMCMKQPYIMLSMLIPGPSSPETDIDVYLQPLIEELKELWVSGLQTYDASRQETFHMHASLLWTISDFPAYANLSGWSTKGKLACPSCNKDTCSLRLKHGRKFCYMGHQRFLEANHIFRSDKSSFNGTKEKRLAPIPLSRTQQDTGGKKQGKRGKTRVQEESPLEENSSASAAKKKEKPPKEHNWKKKRKTKDSVKARLDLQEMGVRRTLHPVTTIRNKTYLPPACFTMSPKEKEVLCNILKDVKLPDGYSSNISRRVNVRERKISGLKSHDCHVLMQQLLPLAIRSSLPMNVSSVLIELCNFFKELCSKVLNVGDLLKLQDRIALTLFHMEKIFPPAFFDIMVHLPIHLVDEAMLAGPVQYRWMYPIERYLLTLKSYVRNRSRPKGSIAEGYLAEECLTFCSRYLEGVQSKLNRPVRNDEDAHVEMEEGFSIFSLAGRPLGEVKSCPLDQTTIEQAHRYVLFNCPAVIPFIAGIKIDAFGYTVVNMTRHIYKNEPFVFASQAEQVFYVQDHPGNKDWHVVVKTKPRDLYEVHGNNDEGDVQTKAAEIQNLEDVNTCEQIDIVGTEIDEPLEQLTQAIPDDEECDTDSDDSDGDESPFVNDK